jgi:hypothetical protein
MMPLRRSITGLATLFLATVALGQQWPDHLWDVDFAYLSYLLGLQQTPKKTTHEKVFSPQAY